MDEAESKFCGNWKWLFKAQLMIQEFYGFFAFPTEILNSKYSA